MNLQEQILRSRKLMCESHEEKISLATDLLNTFLSFDGHIQYEALFDYVDDNRGDDEILGVAVQATIDSSMYHEVSPNYDKNYYDFVERLDDKIHSLFTRYFLDDIEYTLIIYVHKNTDIVSKLVYPMLQKAMDVYHKNTGKVRLKSEIIKNKRRPNLIVYLPYDKEMGVTFNHSEFMDVLEKLYPSGSGSVLDDFVITSYISGYDEHYEIVESVKNNNIICDNCGWSWKKSEGGDDMYTCHKCGHENN